MNMTFFIKKKQLAVSTTCDIYFVREHRVLDESVIHLHLMTRFASVYVLENKVCTFSHTLPCAVVVNNLNR